MLIIGLDCLQNSGTCYNIIEYFLILGGSDRGPTQRGGDGSTLELFQQRMCSMLSMLSSSYYIGGFGKCWSRLLKIKNVVAQRLGEVVGRALGTTLH